MSIYTILVHVSNAANMQQQTKSTLPRVKVFCVRYSTSDPKLQKRLKAAAKLRGMRLDAFLGEIIAAGVASQKKIDLNGGFHEFRMSQNSLSSEK